MKDPHTNPKWEYWPGRTADDGVRNRLRDLFTPKAGDAVAELIAVHARELDERSDELREVVAELAQRETRARELHARVEQVLREGSAELDAKQAELTVRAVELDKRESVVQEAEARLRERRSELGAVELRGAAVERRELALQDRERDLEHRAEGLERRAADLDQRALDLDALSRRLTLAAVAERPESEEARPPSPPDPAAVSAEGSVRPLATLDPAAQREDSHLVFVPGDTYRVVERHGPAPGPGELIVLDEVEHRCIRLAPSPYPGDDRRCAIVERLERPVG